MNDINENKPNYTQEEFENELHKIEDLTDIQLIMLTVSCLLIEENEALPQALRRLLIARANK